MSFFKKGETGLEHIAHRAVAMLGDARHSFDLATAAVLGGADPRSVGEDIRRTDERINRAEQELRGELVVHVSVHGADDIGEVLGYTLLIKKIERIGDQAKNILDLADEGISMVGQPDVDELNSTRQSISEMFGETVELLNDPVEERVASFHDDGERLRHALEAKVREFMHSEAPGSHAVPRAILYRYWKRVVANLTGIVTTATEPLQNLDYLDDGDTDIVDD